MADYLPDPSALLNGTDLRLTIHASLKPASGLDRFQPAGFPEIGHVIYDAPRPDDSVQKVCIVDSAASMANHLEAVCLASEHSLDLVEELSDMPYVECRTDGGGPNVTDDDRGPKQLVATTLSEGHRLASTYFLDGRLVSDGKSGDEKFGTVLRNQFGIADLGKKSHPLPEQWWKVFTTCKCRAAGSRASPHRQGGGRVTVAGSSTSTCPLRGPLRPREGGKIAGLA